MDANNFTLIAQNKNNLKERIGRGIHNILVQRSLLAMPHS